jgi:hypothetical protein
MLCEAWRALFIPRCRKMLAWYLWFRLKYAPFQLGLMTPNQQDATEVIEDLLKLKRMTSEHQRLRRAFNLKDY